MLQNKELLKSSKNLLAFSAGVDSTALFFLLLENSITFDIAIVNYGVREQSQEEVAYAQELALKYSLNCFTFDAEIIEKNFEAKAREIRYTFFERLIQEHHYDNLLTAHHLGDRFEWMLMQFCRGAGCVEFAGMKRVEQRNNYTLLRPLLHLDKQELLAYLHKEKRVYFEDESNKDEKYKRNEFRHNYTTPLLAKYLDGIKKSFEYIDEDLTSLSIEPEIQLCNDLCYIPSSHSKRIDLTAIDKYLKSIGHLCSAKERALLKKNKSVVVGRKYIVIQEHKALFIAPYIVAKNIDKKLKEKFRVLKIPPQLRGYLASDAEAVAFVSRVLQ